VGLSAKASMRRSTRVQVRIPVVVSGTLPNGESFSEETYVLTVSKFGARLKCSYPLTPGMEVRVKPKAGEEDALFHIVWAGGRSGNSGEVGIQFVKASTLFGIVFPD
jgi:PilZ domain